MESYTEKRKDSNIMSAKQQMKDEILEAFIFLRERNHSVPSVTIQFMKDAAIEKLEEIPDEKDGKFYYIQKGMYYRPNAAGYTDRATEAGVYSEKEAKEHEKHCKELHLIEIDVPQHNQRIRRQIEDLKSRLI